MKKQTTLILGAMFLLLQLYSYSACFPFTNDSAPTRFGSLDGPLAGPGIWAQALVGLTLDNLAPLGVPTEHVGDGYIQYEQICPPFANPGGWGWVYVQLAAWDGRVWGTNFTNVPTNQLGHTDTVQVALDVPPGPGYPPKETSADLQAWTPVQTNGLSSGVLELSVPLGTNQCQFVRTRLGP